MATSTTAVVMVDRSYTTAARPGAATVRRTDGRALPAAKAFGLDEHGAAAPITSALDRWPRKPTRLTRRLSGGCCLMPFMNSDAYYAYAERLEHPAEKHDCRAAKSDRHCVAALCQLHGASSPEHVRCAVISVMTGTTVVKTAAKCRTDRDG